MAKIKTKVKYLIRKYAHCTKTCASSIIYAAMPSLSNGPLYSAIIPFRKTRILGNVIPYASIISFNSGSFPLI
jgi:hypothetical protein